MAKLRFDTGKLTVRQLIELRKLEYQRFDPVRCPLLEGEIVYFNMQGFYHLTHDGRNKIRGQADSRMRLNLLPYAPLIIQRAKKFGAPMRVIEVSDPKNKFQKRIKFYELTHKIRENKIISVVLRRIGDGQLHYYSIRYYKKPFKA